MSDLSPRRPRPSGGYGHTFPARLTPPRPGRAPLQPGGQHSRVNPLVEDPERGKYWDVWIRFRT